MIYIFILLCLRKSLITCQAQIQYQHTEKHLQLYKLQYEAKTQWFKIFIISSKTFEVNIEEDCLSADRYMQSFHEKTDLIKITCQLVCIGCQLNWNYFPARQAAPAKLETSETSRN